jgi:hypothetical protein
MDYADRLQIALTHGRVTRKALADELDISVAAVGQVLNRKTKMLDALNHTRAAMFCGVDPLWLAAGKGKTPEISLAHLASPESLIVTPTRITWEELEVLDLGKPFELLVLDDALAPDIYTGCWAQFEPVAKRPPAAGRPVLVKDKDGAHYLRDYQQSTGGRWQAVARQRGFAALDSEADGLTIIATMKGVTWT